MITLETSPLGAEALDDTACPPGIATATLRDIARANAWFGGRAAARHGLARVLAGVRRDAPITLLDVGAGSGDIARDLVRAVRRRGVRLRVLALDTHRAAAALARGADVLPVLGSAAAVPLRHRSVDVVLASQFLHHFTRRSASALVRVFDALARVGVVLCEPRRTAAAAGGIWLAAHMLGFHTVTREDGVLSVRRSFTPAELDRTVRDAGITARIERRPGFRLVAWWRSDDAHR